MRSAARPQAAWCLSVFARGSGRAKWGCRGGGLQQFWSWKPSLFAVSGFKGEAVKAKFHSRSDLIQKILEHFGTHLAPLGSSRELNFHLQCDTAWASSTTLLQTSLKIGIYWRCWSPLLLQGSWLPESAKSTESKSSRFSMSHQANQTWNNLNRYNSSEDWEHVQWLQRPLRDLSKRWDVQRPLRDLRIATDRHSTCMQWLHSTRLLHQPCRHLCQRGGKADSWSAVTCSGLTSVSI